MTEKLNLVSTKVALARACGMTRQGLDFYLKMPGAPKARPNGFWDADEVVAWVNAHKPGGDDESERLRLQKLRNEVAQGELELLKSGGEAIPVAWCHQLFAHLAVSVRGIIQSAAIDDAEKERMTAAIEQIDPASFLADLRKEVMGE